jgi:hypothetical protein
MVSGLSRENVLNNQALNHGEYERAGDRGTFDLSVSVFN